MALGETPRTWVLRPSQSGEMIAMDGPYEMLEEILVIELRPVLDLLERHLPMDGKSRCAADRETVALLHEYRATMR